MSGYNRDLDLIAERMRAILGQEGHRPDVYLFASQTLLQVTEEERKIEKMVNMMTALNGELDLETGKPKADPMNGLGALLGRGLGALGTSYIEQKAREKKKRKDKW